MLGDILSSAVSVWNAEKNRDANYESQSRSQDFNERMSSTQYQRMVQDLNAAGLSPMLAYSKATGSAPTSSPVGSSASIEAPKFGESSVRQAQADLAREQAEVAKSTTVVNEASAAKLAAETRNIDQDTENKRLYPGMNEAQIQELISRAGQHGASSRQLDALMEVLKQERKLKEPEEKFKEDHPTYSKYASPVMDALRTIFGSVGLLRGTSALPNVTKVERAKR